MKRSSPIRRSGLLLVAAIAAAGAGPRGLLAQDVAYSNINDTVNHGAVGGIRAYSLGTQTCNISDASLSWVNDGTPGVAFNMFRLANGRLTQIGQSWVKTACCVSNGSSPLCGGTCSSSGFGLRPHCMDTYSASWNAIQSNLAPRSGTNAFAGTFSPIPGGSGDAIWRRLQVQQTDLSNGGGAQHFVDGVYVCTEEAGLPTQWNNASYRRVTVNQSTFALTLQDSTQIGIPGIRAWRDHGLGAGIADPSVTVDIVDVPSEGRFWYAWKVTDLGGGNYRYDYGVYNLNSDKAGGSFSVPCPPCANPTNLGFSAPPYHSGEPYSNAAWNGTAGSGTVSWTSPQSFAQNANTNALRWGTMYNFWFEASRPPVAGNVTLGLFKPHSPQSISIPAAVPQGCPTMLADVSTNNSIDGEDVAHFVNCLLSGTTAGGDCCCADLNQSGPADMGDVPLFSDQLVGP